MNILEIEDIIKGLPDQALVQEAQAPSGQMPQFLVVSEIQRRADMRKRFQNQQQEMPQGTIAQQIVQGGIASMGNQQPIQPMPPQGMPQQGMPPMPQQGMPMQQQPPMMPPMSPPMMPPAQGMAGGGVVRMQKGELVPYTGGTGLTEYGQNLFSQGLGEGQTVEEIVRNIYNYRPSTTATARGSRRDPDQPSTEEYIKSIYGDDFSTPGLYSGIFRGPGAESLYMEEVMGRIGSSVPVTESPIPSPLTTDSQGSATETLLTGETPSLESLLQYKSPLSFGDNYNVENPLDMDSKRFYETTINEDPKDLAPMISLGLSDRTPKDKVDEDTMKRPQGPDYSAAKSILDELQAVDYSAFKPDYAGLITEQERRAQKIRDDASKDASAQALIQLGAGLAAGDISKGLSAAGQSVADIKRQARAEARDEEGFARQLRLAQDEAGMQIGLKQAEAERSIQLQRAGMAQDEANAQAKADVEAYEFSLTFGLDENKMLADVMKERGLLDRASLSAVIEQWKSLSDAATEEDIATRNALKSQIESMLRNIKRSQYQLEETFNFGSAAVPTPQGSSGGFNLIGTRPGQ